VTAIASATLGAVTDRGQSANGMVATIHLALHGVRVRVSSDQPDLLRGVRETWGRLIVAGSNEPEAVDDRATAISACLEGGRLVFRDSSGTYGVAAGGSPLVVLFDRIVHGLNRALDRSGIMAVHAGAVELGGRALILAGPSGRGKSTLVVELVRVGAGLLSDESALVAPDNRTILPYPRAIHLRPSSVALIGGLGDLGDQPRHDLGGGSEVALDPTRVGALLGGRLSPGAPLGGVLLLGERLAPDAEPRIDSISPAIAVMELLRGTPAASWTLDATRHRLIDVLGSVPCASLRAGRLGATASLVAGWAEATR
jgi:hypothetical protein